MKQIQQITKNKVFPLLANGDVIYMLNTADRRERIQYCKDMTVRYIQDGIDNDDCIFFVLEDVEVKK